LFLRDFRNCHEGEAFLIVGCGISARNADAWAGNRVLLGVNDCEYVSQLGMDYLVLQDPEENFDNSRHEIICNTSAIAFTLYPWDHFEHQCVTPFGRGYQDEPDLWKAWLPRGPSTIVPAVALALWMGAVNIALVGVEIYGHPALDEPGAIGTLNKQFESIRQRAQDRGVVIQVACESRITTLPRLRNHA
jgi:hypothetical protein